GEVVSRIPDPFNNARVLMDIAVEALYRAVKRGRNKRIAVLVDDVFQAIGLDKAELLVKQFLNMIEYPSIKYDKIVVVMASSEGVTRRGVGRHRWAYLFIMRNMPREGFRRLYDLLPGEKPPFEEVWRWTGGNPKALEMLYEAGWDMDRVVERMALSRGLVSGLAQLGDAEREVLAEALEDPDALLRRIREAPGLAERLTELNLIVEIYHREPYLWVDQPPPERDLELGIGKYYAWQTPLHREAVRRALTS
ncbi:MAG: ATP-binding protein, partial [Thermoproteus sp.]